MSLDSELKTRVSEIITETWDIKSANVVPVTEGVLLAGGGRTMNVTMLYADLANSTELALYNRQVAAKICKAFLACASKIIRFRGGKIRSFDGDRVMGVFSGGFKNTSAVKAALNINFAFDQIIVPKFQARYPSLFSKMGLAHGVGVDTSDVLVVRGGMRANNDLLWIGRAPNIAAKLSSLRMVGYSSYITKDVFDVINNEAKFSPTDGSLMWESRTWSRLPSNHQSIYMSKWWIRP